ncbi:Pimeloyl-[acyl-carrier] methyl ester esterase-like protein [Cladobotryum mycophilum]|uniref:Pimeloyl-[acyl-carrier] methyl ester esterase-like protein n=1 Tax=Cladobotryum mycophilum TaxID=491253 RepID=A0ABR0SBL0_9HYPO
MANVTLDLVQRLPTSGARAVADVQIQKRHYLAIPQLAEDIPGGAAGMNLGDSDVPLLLYRYDEHVGDYKIFQTLPVPGGEDAEFFSINQRIFLATASLRSGKGPYNLDVESTIFEWNGTNFVEFQRIPTFAAKQWRYFTVAGRHFLALAQGVAIPGIEPKIPADSTIYEWDGSCFQSFQTVPSKWGYNWLHFSFNGDDFLAYADHVTPSILLRWNGHSFAHFQHLDGAHGRAFAFFQDGDDAYLVFSLLSEESVLYRWNGNDFRIHQKLLAGPGGRELALIHHEGETYLILVRFITGTRENPTTALQSVVYGLKNGILEPVTTFPTLGGTDVVAITRDGQIYLVVSESLTKTQHFRTDSKVYRFSTGMSSSKSTDRAQLFQAPAFLDLFTAYTASKTSIGFQLAATVKEATSSLPLLVATSFDMILFPGKGRDPSYMNFRLGSRGFKELAATSHLGPALGSLIQMRENGASDEVWRAHAENLLEKTEVARRANSVALWKDQIQVEAFQGRESAISAMIDYAFNLTIAFLRRVLDDPDKLSPEFLRENYLEATGSALDATVPFNAVMIATFFLVGLDISYRMRKWLKANDFEWKQAMVLITGRQGRETSGVTVSTNSVAQILIQSSNMELPVERLFIAPHGIVPVIQNPVTADSLRTHEHQFRSLWSSLFGTGQLGETMFSGYPSYQPERTTRPVINASTLSVPELPKISHGDDWFAMNTRMRVVLEDARQLLSGCVTDYAAEQLRQFEDDLTKIVIPGLDGVDFTAKKRLSGYGEKQETFALTPSYSPTCMDLPVAIQKYKVQDGLLAYRECGPLDSDPVIWVHGLPLDSRSWSAQYDEFSQRFHNVFVDLRGYGASSKLPLLVTDITQLYCDDILALMDHLNISTATIVGFASAGHVALRFAAQQPDRVSKLVLLNASPRFKRNNTDYPFGFSEEVVRDHFIAAAKRGIEEITNAVLDPATVFQDLSSDDAAKVVSWFRKMAHDAGADTLRGFFEIIANDDDRHLVPLIKAPTLLLSSSLGKEVPAQTALYLRQHLQQAKLVEVPDADHFLHVTRSAVVNQLISTFLESTKTV